MFSKEDVIKCLHEIVPMKKKTYDIYQDLHARLRDANLKEGIGRILFDEKEHKEIIEEAVRLLSQ
jgi:rubrerythrin